jgi:hypothetical protein
MKKVLTFLAIAAMMCFVSCHKENNKGGKGGGKSNYEAPITVDGNFDDWAKLDASKVAVANCAADNSYSSLKTMKVYADEYFVYIYFQFVGEDIEDRAWVPVHLYINGDGNEKTGGFGDEFSDACADIMTEGAIFADGEFCSYNPSGHKWVGEVNGTGWDGCWEEVAAEGSNFCSGMGSGNQYEIRMIREMYPGGKLADVFSIGMDIQQNWNSVGILPNTTPDPDNNPSGHAALLQVTTVK